jgi:Cd2+/Zn2+-exporting ATPase
VFPESAAAERHSEHPLAKAIGSAAMESGVDIPEPKNFESLPGHGVYATIGEYAVIIGERMLQNFGVEIDEQTRSRFDACADSGNTVIPVAVDNEVAGLFILADTIREESERAVSELKELNVSEILLVSGDREVIAESVGRQLGVDRIHAGLLPEEKLDLIRGFREKGKRVAFVGDGVNDAPAMALANVGIALGGIGTHVTMETADIVLLTDRLERLPYLVSLSRKALRAIRNNVIFSMAMISLSITLSIFGIIGPIIGALMHEMSAIPVVANSSRLIGRKPTGKECI